MDYSCSVHVIGEDLVLITAVRQTASINVDCEVKVKTDRKI